MKPEPSAASLTLLENPAYLPVEARIIEGSNCADVPRLLSAVAKALTFPDYFGGNWDALDECLADLGWLDSPATLVFREAGCVLREAPSERATLLKILSGTALPDRLKIVFQDRPEGLQAWRQLCASRGIPFSDRLR
jgi:RNAse (barnase) inhibitor barstar